MTTPKLIALDMDGTMLNGDSSLTRRTKEALRAAQVEGELPPDVRDAAVCLLDEPPTALPARRVLDALGFGNLDSTRGLYTMHANKAAEENLRMLREEVSVDFYDDDGAHVTEHTRFLLSDEFSGDAGAKARFEAHLRAHGAQKREKEDSRAAADSAAAKK